MEWRKIKAITASADGGYNLMYDKTKLNARIIFYYEKIYYLR